MIFHEALNAFVEFDFHTCSRSFCAWWGGGGGGIVAPRMRGCGAKLNVGSLGPDPVPPILRQKVNKSWNIQEEEQGYSGVGQGAI